MSVVRPIYSTMGQSSPAAVAEGTDNPYRWHKIPGWDPNAPGYRPGQAEAPDEPGPANATRTAGRAARLEEFAGYLGQGLTAQQAGKLMRIAPGTAREYARELERRQRGEPAP